MWQYTGKHAVSKQRLYNFHLKREKKGITQTGEPSVALEEESVDSLNNLIKELLRQVNFILLTMYMYTYYFLQLSKSVC